MAIKKDIVTDGVFIHEHTGASLKDTPRKDFEEGLKNALEEAGRRNTPGYILEHLEKYARAKMEAPPSERKAGQRPENYKKELEADQRHRRDCSELLREIDFLRTISDKETDHDFLMARFFYLGTLAQQADIRPIEPSAFQAMAESKRNSLKGQKERTRNKLTPAERTERNERILADFAKSHLSLESFTKHHAKKDPYIKGAGEYLSRFGIKNVINNA